MEQKWLAYAIRHLTPGSQRRSAARSTPHHLDGLHLLAANRHGKPATRANFPALSINPFPTKKQNCCDLRTPPATVQPTCARLETNRETVLQGITASSILTDSRSEYQRQPTPSYDHLRALRNATNLNPTIAPAAPRASRPKRAAAAPQLSCDDCYFHQNDLCALDKAKPCPTFRAAADNLAPPQQLSFVFRQERTRSAFVFAQPR